VAICVSLLLHATLLSLHFTFPEASRQLRGKALDIVLVNARSERKPTDAQVLAQANLDGGGTSDEDRIASSPLPASPRQQDGNELEQAEQRVQTLEAEQQRLLMQAERSRRTAPPSVKKESSQPAPEPVPEPILAPENPVLNGRDLASSMLEMARLQAKIDRQSYDYGQWPRMKTMGPRAQEGPEAFYLIDWAKKVERIGTLNFPKGKIYGKVGVWIVLRPDGDLYKLEVAESSGNKTLDDAALRIIRMGAPYGDIPKAVLGNYDVYGFARTLLFTNDNRMSTN
jgi:protein TonB